MKIVLALLLGLIAVKGASALNRCLNATSTRYSCQVVNGSMNLYYCGLEDEDWVDFASCLDAAGRKSILELDLTNNDFSTLPDGGFQGLSALQKLDLDDNAFTFTNVSEGAFSGLSALQELDLSENDLTTLPVGIFNDLTALQDLNLENCDLTTLPAGIFSNLTALVALDLSENDLTTLPVGIFNDLTALQDLNLENCDLTTLPAGIFSNLTALAALNMISNSLVTVPEKAFQGLTSLLTLTLEYNDFNNISAGAFQGLTALQTLGLQHTPLTTLPEGVFDDLSALVNLDLHHNALVTLPGGVFSDLPALRTLDLSTNKLTTLSEGTFFNMTALETLSLYENTLITLPERIFSDLQVLQKLELQDNALTTLSEGIFDDLSALQHLNLKDNALECLPGTGLAELGDGASSSADGVHVDEYGTECGCSIPHVIDNVCGEETCTLGPEGYTCEPTSPGAPVGAIVGGSVGGALVLGGLILLALFMTGRIKSPRHGKSPPAASVHAGNARSSSEDADGRGEIVVTESTLSGMRAAPSFGAAAEQSMTGVPPSGSCNDDNLPGPRVAILKGNNGSPQAPTEDNETLRGMWPPSTVIKDDRAKATAIWMLLLAAFISYVVYISLNSVEMRKNPPVKLLRKEEPFNLPDVVICPSAGDGCNGSDGSDCLPMDWFLSAVEGLSGCEKYFATPAPTPAPSDPTPAPIGFAGDYSDDYDESDPTTPAPIVRPAIRYNLETAAHEWCPRVPLSECVVDSEGVDSGDVRSLHASFYVLWDDTVVADPMLSTRRFINMFFVDEDAEVADAVVAVRLPYDRVNITGSNPVTFSSNDVVLSMSQFVPLGSGGDSGLVERTYTQATTTSQHTLMLDTFEDEEYEGALLYVTLSVNKFAFQSIEEIDPVDWWTLLGSAGGVWEIICVIFGACFVARQAIGPDKKWGWEALGGNGEQGRCSCMK